jgi:hypothetical protein
VHGRIYMYVYTIYTRPLSDLRTAERALWYVAHVTTAAKSLKRTCAWPPPSLSLLYFLYRASPCPLSRIFTLSWFCMTFHHLREICLQMVHGANLGRYQLSGHGRFLTNPYPLNSSLCSYLLVSVWPLRLEEAFSEILDIKEATCLWITFTNFNDWETHFWRSLSFVLH